GNSAAAPPGSPLSSVPSSPSNSPPDQDEKGSVDDNGGFLQSRVKYIRQRLAGEPGLYWPNQYASAAGPRVHRDRTAQSIFGELGHVDCVFIGAGTTGTLMGCADFVPVEQSDEVALAQAAALALARRVGDQPMAQPGP
ncbi:hypothetical protein ACIODT_38710, partial [Streptomyces sp. NPDC088251]